MPDAVRPPWRVTRATRASRIAAPLCALLLLALVAAPQVWARPMMTPPASVPQNEPSPPMITASKA